MMSFAFQYLSDFEACQSKAKANAPFF